MSEKNKLPSEKTNDFSETSTIDTEKIGSDTEKIEVNTEKIPEIIPEITRYRGQRGPDKAPRRINPKSLGNLKPFQNIPVPKPNSDKGIWIVIGILATVLVGILIWRIYEWRKKKSEEK